MKTISLFAIALSLITLPAQARTGKVLIIANEGFQVDEYFTPKALFEKAGYQVLTAARYPGMVNPGKKYQSTHPSVKVDLTFEEIRVNDYDAISFTGGGGAWSDYFPNRTLHRVLMESIARKDMIVGLICAGAGLLATANNLVGNTPQFKNRHVTGYGEVAGLLTRQGQVKYESGDSTKPHVVVDENLITGRDPMSSELYGEMMVRKMKTRL